MDFSAIGWVTLGIIGIPIIALEILIRFGPKGRRTQTVAGATMLVGFLQGSSLIDVIPADQWPFVTFVLGYAAWRLRVVTTGPVGG